MLDFTQAQTGDTTRYREGDKAMLWAGDADASSQVIGGGRDGCDDSVRAHPG
ncbi:MAG: hypothetical protein HZT40_00985 [Candidatus Thiothrix singaporensis]|uniref:Uncharacterized protein n=1 Tax=Candidatus Thiothrix singaporensis TaxID=2799669 RepID=A0A7L6AMS3_9GAMM|nr:MAG: hypothetical protein HZT40_00985 [Candidatus Thiothrix singaporensis]